MLQGWVVVLSSLAYLGLLFGVGRSLAIPALKASAARH